MDVRNYNSVLSEERKTSRNSRHGFCKSSAHSKDVTHHLLSTQPGKRPVATPQRGLEAAHTQPPCSYSHQQLWVSSRKSGDWFGASSPDLYCVLWVSVSPLGCSHQEADRYGVPRPHVSSGFIPISPIASHLGSQ